MELDLQQPKHKPEADPANTTIVWEFNKNARGEVLRIDCHTWKGKPLVAVRTWYRDRDSGELRPGREGFSIHPDKLAELETGIKAAAEEARKRGWL